MNKLIYPAKDDNTPEINFFDHLHNVSSFIQYTHWIKAIITSHVRVHASNTKVFVTPYYKPYKKSSVFTAGLRISKADKRSVVSKFTCNDDG